MATWSGGGSEKRVGVADMIGKLVIIYVTGYHRNVPTRKYGSPQVVEEQDQLHADVILIDRMTGAATEYRDQTVRSWAIIKVARGSVGGDPLLGTMESPNGQANNAKWRSLADAPEAIAAADRWVSQYGPEGYKRSAAREPEAHTPQAPQQPPQQGYQGWPQGSMPAQQYYQQQAPPQWAQQQPQYGQPPQMPQQQPVPQWAQQQPSQQAPQWGNQPQGYGGQQGQPQQQNPQWGQSQQPAQPPQWMQQQAPQQQVGQQQPPQTSLQAMMAAGAVAPPPQAPMGYDRAPADQGQPPF